MDIVDIPIPSSLQWSPRISPKVFSGAQFLALSLAICACASRTSLRVYRFKRVTVDDVFLILACLFFAASTGVIEYGKNLMYYSTYMNLGLVEHPVENYKHYGYVFSVVDNIVTVFVWAAIFCVKLSFVLFFRQLISRVRNVQIWWWLVFVAVCCAAPVNMFMGFYICPEFNENLIRSSCPTASIISKTYTYLWTSCILDIVTDLLVITIPVVLLWKVKIDLRRKIALLTVLCLSVFMIVISVVRIALIDAKAPNGRSAPDTPWLIMWQNIEAATAVVMVSVTAFRSMLGQAKISRSERHSLSRRYFNLKNRASNGSQSRPLAKDSSIVKTTRVSNSFDDRKDWPHGAISQPMCNISIDEQTRFASEPQRDWSHERLPGSPPAPQGQSGRHMGVDEGKGFSFV